MAPIRCLSWEESWKSEITSHSCLSPFRLKWSRYFEKYFLRTSYDQEGKVLPFLEFVTYTQVLARWSVIHDIIPHGVSIFTTRYVSSSLYQWGLHESRWYESKLHESNIMSGNRARQLTNLANHIIAANTKTRTVCLWAHFELSTSTNHYCRHGKSLCGR